MSAEPEQQSRQRVALAIALAALTSILVVAVGVLASAGGGDDAAATPPPQECLEKWNADQPAIAYAIHNRTFHRYRKAQVGYMPAGGGDAVSDDPAAGSCVVVFARSALDPEPSAAGQIERAGSWVPLTQIAVGNELAELQNAALRAANAQPTEDGKLAPL